MDLLPIHHFATQTHIPSACILAPHPVILPIPYHILSHLVGLTACILCFTLNSIPRIVVGSVCGSANAGMPGASVNTMLVL